MASFLVLFCALLVAVVASDKDFRLELNKFTNRISHRIVNGEDAQANQFPHQVSVEMYWGAGHYQHHCGGSIIAPRWVLTAAHCLTEAPPVPFRIVAGILRLSDASKGQIIDVKRYVVHPDYQGGVNPNDIALLRLRNPLELNEAVRSIKLSEENVLGEAVVTGWGSTSTTNIPIYPIALQKATLNVVTHEVCADALIKLFGTSSPLDKKSNICTMDELNKGACSGDSGGPLIIGEGTNTKLIGIVSWGVTPCGHPGAPSVFTSVRNFLDFINENTSQ